MNPRDAFRVLGLPPGADPSDVRAAWRSLARDLHSDFHQDKPPEERQRLEDKLREVNAASDALKHFFELPAADRSRILGLEARERSRSHVRQSQPSLRRHNRPRRTSLWLLIPAAAVPLVVAVTLTRHEHDLPGTVAQSADPVADWVGRTVVPVFCDGAEECRKPACRSAPVLESLRTAYNIPDAYVVYGTPDRSRRSWLFHSVEPSVRSDIYSVSPQIVVSADSAAALRSKLGSSRTSHACRLTVGDPITLAVHLGALGREVRIVREERESILQLDDLETPDRPEAPCIARFQSVPGDDFLSFRYGHRPEGIIGAQVPGAPADAADVGSMYQVRYRTVEYSRDGKVAERNHEFVSLKRLSGGEEALVYRNVPLQSKPHVAIRTLERIDIAGTRQCQAMAEAAEYTACAIRLVRSLELANRIDSVTAHNLRFRFRHPELE